MYKVEIKSPKRFKIRKRIIAAVLLTVVVSLYLMFSLFMERWLSKEQESIIRNSMGDIFRGSVDIRRVGGDLVNSLSIEGLKVRSLKGQGPDFSAENLVFDYDIAGLLLKKMPVSKIRIISGMLSLERDSAGKWNFLELFKKGNSPRQLYIPEVEVDNSEVGIKDFIFLKKDPDRLPMNIDLSIKNGFAKINSENFLKFNSIAYIKKFPGAEAHISATISFKDVEEKDKKVLDLISEKDFTYTDKDFVVKSVWSLNGTDIPLKPFGRYISDNKEVDYMTGEFDFALTSEASTVRSRKIYSSIGGEVNIKEGKLRFEPLKMEITHINGQIGFSDSGWAMGGLAFNMGSVPFTVLEGGIKRSVASEELKMKIKTFSADLSDYVNLFGVSAEVSGDTSLTLDIKQFGNFIEYYGDIKCAVGNLGGVNFKDGVFLFSRNDSTYDFSRISLKTCDGILEASGSADHSGKHIPFSFNVDAHNIDLSRLKESIPDLSFFGISGMLEGNLRLDGDFKTRKTNASGNIELKNITILGLVWKKISISFNMKDNILTMKEIRIEEGPQTPLICKGIKIDLNEKEPAYSFEIEVGRADLKTIELFVPKGMFKKLTVTGTLEKGNIIISGKGFTSEFTKIVSSLDISNLKVSGFTFKRVMASFEYMNKKLNVSGINLKGAFGDLNLKGTYSKEKGIDMKCESKGADFIKFLTPLYPETGKKLSQSGPGILDIDISGTLKKPDIKIKAGIEYLDVAGYPIKNITGDFSFKENLVINALKCDFNYFHAHSKGEYDYYKGLSLKGIINAPGISDVISGASNMAGSDTKLTAGFEVKGPFESLDYTLNAEKLVISENPVLPLCGDLQVYGSITPDFTSFYKGQIYSDKMKTENNLNIEGDEKHLKIRAEKISLDNLPGTDKFNSLAFGLKFDLFRKKESFSGSLNISDFAYGKLSFKKDFISSVILKNGVIELKKGVIPDFGRIFGRYNFKQRFIDLKCLVSEPGASKKVALFFDKSLFTFSRVKGLISLYGPLNSLETKIDTKFEAPLLYDMSFEKMGFKGSGKNRAFKFSAALTSGKEEISFLSENRDIGLGRVEIKVDSIKASRLNSFIKRDIMPEKYIFNGNAIYEKGLLTFKSLQLKKNKNAINISGSIRPDFNNGELDIKTVTSGFPLSDIIGTNQIKDITGSLKLNVSIKGKVSEPKIGGNAEISNISFRPSFLKKAVKISTLNIKASKNKFQILPISEGDVVIKGGFDASFKNADDFLENMDISFVLKDYRIRNNQQLTGKLKKEISFTGVIDSENSVKGSLSDFKIDSELKLSNSSVTFSLSESKPVKMPEFLNDRIKLKIKLGKNVWFRNNIISTELDGGFQAGVHENELVLNGKIFLLRGKFNYLSNEFDIIEGHLSLNSLTESEDEFNLESFKTEDLVLNFNLDNLRLEKPDFSIDTKRHQLVLAKEGSDIKKRASVSVHLNGKTYLKGIDVFTVISGSMDDLKMNFYSDPPQDQLYIESLLTRGEVLTVSSDPGGTGQDAINMVGAELTNTLWKKFSSSLAENFNLSEFSIKSSSIRSGDLKGPAIHLGKYLDDDLYFSYKRIFAEKDEETLGLEYHFRRKVILDTELKRDQESEDFTMGLKLKRSF